MPIDEVPLRGMTLKILRSIIISTAFIVTTVLGAYWASHEKNEVQDLQIETLRLNVQQITLQLHDMQMQINQKKDKADK